MCRRGGGTAAGVGLLRWPRWQSNDRTTHAEGDDGRTQYRGRSGRRAPVDHQPGVRQRCADPGAVHLQGSQHSAAVNVVGAVGDGTCCRRSRRGTRTVHSLDRHRNPPGLRQHGRWSDSGWREQPAEHRRPACVHGAVSAGGHRDTPLPLYSLPASQHVRTPGGVGRWASGADYFKRRNRTGSARRNVRGLTR